MELLEQFGERVVVLARLRAGGEGTPKRGRNTGLIGQSFDTDQSAFHVILAAQFECSPSGHWKVKNAHKPREFPRRRKSGNHVAWRQQ